MSISAAEFLKWCEVFRVNFGGGGSPIAFPVSPTLGGTGVSNDSASTQTINGAYPLAWTLTGNTSLTLPESGTLATVGQLPSFPLTPDLGGTGIDNGSNTLTIGANSAINQDVSTTADVTFNSLLASDYIHANSDISSSGFISANLGVTAGQGIVGSSAFGQLSTITTAGGTTTLTVTSNQYQRFIGSSNQTVVLPVSSTLLGSGGQYFVIINESSGTVTVQSSGLNTLQAMAPNTILIARNIAQGGTGTNQWTWEYYPTAINQGVSTTSSPTFAQLNVDNLRLDGNTISSTDTNGNINIIADGSGETQGITTFGSPIIYSDLINGRGVIQVTGTGTQNGAIAVGSFGSVSGGLFNGFRSRSTTPGVFSAVSNLDILTRINCWADDGEKFVRNGLLQWRVSGTVSTNIVPSDFLIQTTNTSGVLTTALTIDNAQNATFAGTVASRGINLALGTLTGTGPYTPLNISATTTAANNTFTGINISHTNTNANTTSTGININIADNSASVVPINGVNCVVTESRATGASATSFASGKFTIATPSGAATLSNVNYYGVQGIANNQKTGGTTNTYAGHFSAVGPSTVYGVYASATGGNTNWGVYSAAGNNFFNGAITCNAWGTGVATALGQNVMGSGGIALTTNNSYAPELRFGGANVGMTYSAQNGRYVRIGDTVLVIIQIILTAKGSSTGAATVTLPVNVRAASITTLFNVIPSALTYTNQVIAFANPSGSTVSISQTNIGSGNTPLTDTAFANNSAIYITGTYQV